jgi:hypothetical protein
MREDERECVLFIGTQFSNLYTDLAVEHLGRESLFAAATWLEREWERERGVCVCVCV